MPKVALHTCRVVHMPALIHRDMCTHVYIAYANKKEFEILSREKPTSFLLTFHWPEQATLVLGMVEECDPTQERKEEEILNMDAIPGHYHTLPPLTPGADPL